MRSLNIVSGCGKKKIKFQHKRLPKNKVLILLVVCASVPLILLSLRDPRQLPRSRGSEHHEPLKENFTFYSCPTQKIIYAYNNLPFVEYIIRQKIEMLTDLI
ncbi:hypothetical protein CDG79_28000 [Nostoc sp. 'Peltigera membranacea cyanobiont' 232]|nr:hypothetical protein CDG79_28000 [Nostoc sp. 'Peltigera membranacea cyanobiont' 232]